MRTLIQRKWLYVGIAAVLIAVAIAAVGIRLFSEENAPIQFAAGDTIVLIVSADSLEYMYGYQFNVYYDKDKLDYVGDAMGGLISRIDGIQTIFSQPMDVYELVGATMIGEKDGVIGKNLAVCEMAFTAKQGGALSDLTLSIADVSVVKSGAELEYLEGVQGWTHKVEVRNAGEAK